jgi:putative addiction module killer protein
MLELKQTESFRKWRTRLKDERARALIASRLDRLAYGHTGDTRGIGDGISELRIHYGPGYRIYFQRRATPCWFCFAAETRARRTKIS